MQKMNFQLGLLLFIFSGINLIGCSDVIKEDLPVKVSFRQSVMDQGLVAQIYNDTDRYLRLQMHIEEGASSDKTEWTVVLEPFSTTEFGWFQGWAFSTGEVFSLHHEDFKSETYQVPK